MQRFLASPSPPSSPSVAPLLKGLKDYRYIAVLGRGHFGKVLMAEDLAKKELVAVKVCSAPAHCSHCL